MKLEYGDMFSHIKSGEPMIIAHGCNNKGVMGEGFAKSLVKLYPGVKEEYLKDDCYVLGLIHSRFDCEHVSILNCITQNGYGRDGTKYVLYDALDQAMEDVAATGRQEECQVHFPLIGAGLGGGNESIIMSILAKNFPGDTGVLWIL